MKRIYCLHPVLINETIPEGDPWKVSFQVMFHMSGDSHLFWTKEKLVSNGCILKGNHFEKDGDLWFPLYEAKMFWNYDHRFSTYEDATQANLNKGTLPQCSSEKKSDPYFTVFPQYWVEQKELEKKNLNTQRYFFTFRDITNSVNERAGIFCFIPRCAVNHKAPIFLSQFSLKHLILLMANFNSIDFDYFSRQKIGGMSYSYFIFKQLPVLPPSTYTPELQSFILPRVIELTYTAWDLEPFAQDILAENGPDTWNQWFPNNPLKEGRPLPFRWDEERRAVLRAELDALYAKLYGLTNPELEYILTTFPVLEKNEVREFGEYRTRRLVLEAWERMEGSE